MSGLSKVCPIVTKKAKDLRTGDEFRFRDERYVSFGVNWDIRTVSVVVFSITAEEFNRNHFAGKVHAFRFFRDYQLDVYREGLVSLVVEENSREEIDSATNKLEEKEKE